MITAIQFETVIENLLGKCDPKDAYNTMAYKFNQFYESCVNGKNSEDDKRQMQHFLVGLLHVVSYLHQEDDALIAKLEKGLNTLERQELSMSAIDKVFTEIGEVLDKSQNS